MRTDCNAQDWSTLRESEFMPLEPGRLRLRVGREARSEPRAVACRGTSMFAPLSVQLRTFAIYSEAFEQHSSAHPGSRVQRVCSTGNVKYIAPADGVKVK